MSGLPWRAPPPPVQLAGVSDLTVLTPMRQGLIPGVWDTVTWHERFERVLRLLDTLRKLSREASPTETPFVDLVGRWQIVHFFRFAAVGADRTGGVPQILLNVTFDGVWEPYMRVIWGPLGPLLDLIFCHAETYRPAHRHGFDAYMEWVRANEVRPGFFYADGGLQAGDLTATVHDRSWAVAAERMRRTERPGSGIDAALEAWTLPAPPRPQPLLELAASDTVRFMRAVSTGLRVLRAFFSLRLMFGAEEPGGSSELKRAVHALLEEFHDFVRADGFRHPMLQPLANENRDVLEWFDTRVAEAVRPAREPALAAPRRARLQHGVLDGHAGAHGLVLLARVRAQRPGERVAPLVRLREQLRNFGRVAPGVRDGEPEVTWTLGFTPQGMAALGVPAAELQRRFPLDFRQGMEARGPAMGDLGPNHPQQWKRPRRNWAVIDRGGAPEVDDTGAARIDLQEVHLAIQLRTELAPGERPPSAGRALRRLRRIARGLDAIGLEILSAQPLQRRSVGSGETARSGHFEFADPVSQPRLPDEATPTNPRHWSDAVPWGEVLLGHDNPRRGDEAWPVSADPVLDNGSFWVMRKLRQYRGRWLDKVPNAADREAMMGRRADGSALVPTGPGGRNDFRFSPTPGSATEPGDAGDPEGRACPFASHVRRANPRTDPAPGQPWPRGQPAVPRILRRGVSYGPSWRERGDDGADRGLLFMAFNARIAEQFETLQRWLAGGNSTGVPSTHDDPICGVPRHGRSRSFSWVDAAGQVHWHDLGTEPFVELQWGLYLFVPSLDGLAALADLGAAATAAPAPCVPAPPQAALPAPHAPLAAWKEMLETGPAERRHACWAAIRAAGGVMATRHYGTLVGSAQAVLEVLRDDGSRFSVAGYGERMQRSLGLGYLGEDEPAHGVLAPAVNAAIEAVTQGDVYGPARAAMGAYLGRLRTAPDTRLVPVDLVALVEAAIAEVCAELFGLPDGVVMGDPRPRPAPPPLPAGTAHCPRDQFLVARYVFLPHPDPVVELLGRASGEKLASAGREKIKALQAPGAAPARLARAVLDAVSAAMAGSPDDERRAAEARTLVGILQGLPATVAGHLTKLLVHWAELGLWWDVQRELLAMGDAGRASAVEVAAGLLPRIRAQMLPDPIPDLLWRRAARATTLAGVRIEAGQTVVLSLRSAAADPMAAADPAGRYALLFGRAPGGTATLHGCPGMAIAEGLMMAVLVAMAEAGSWRRSGSPTLLWLERGPRTGAPAE